MSIRERERELSVTWYVSDSDSVAGLVCPPSSWQAGRGGGRTVAVQTAGIVAEINLLR